jgi:glucose/arabinose dehydrogenase
VPLNHVHLGDGSFLNSHAGRTEFFYDTDYRLRVRHRDSSGEPATQWSEWSIRNFRTSAQPPPGTSVAWTLRQPGFVVETFASGLELPVNIAFVPNPGSRPTDPFLYVTELYGNIKVVTRNGVASDYTRGVLNYRPSGSFPGSGEQGLTGITVEPVSGDVFVSMLYRAADGLTYPKIMRFHSSHGGIVSNSSSTVLDMAGEWQRESHQISNLTIGPDGKLYVHMGDGFDVAMAQNLNSFRGKILRMNLDGTPPADNPFYNATDGITARDYVFAYGFRNPFGGAWRAADNQLYAVENGPSVDRLLKVVAGRNYLWDGTDASMRNFAIFTWQPSVAPVNMAFIQPQTFNGSGFPAAKQGNGYVSESGPTYGTGPQTNGKRISEFVLDAGGNWLSGPTPLLEYTGTGKATVSGIAAGPDGLYFTDLYKDQGTSPTAVGANILRVRYTGILGPDFALSDFPDSRQIRRGTSTTYRIDVTPSGGFTGEVSFTVSGLPSNASSILKSVVITSGTASSTLGIRTTRFTPAGTYLLTVTGTGGGLQRTTQVTLRMTN